ncbi:MAG: ArsC family reductase [Gammaproteobacteria bacterium]|nr:ArsC family reductase [Gammaproteobacteria bacterium]
MTTIYGIKNCDTMKKAMQWLDDHGVEYQFHDFKKSGVDEKLLKSWIKQVGWEPLVNQRGTTWRKLSEADRANLDEAKAIKVMLANNSLIKRPVLDVKGKLHIGFSDGEYSQFFNNK